jgi:hypothetical protein
MAKTSAQCAKATGLDASLRKMFRALEGRPVPQAIGRVVDQLEVQAAPPLRKAS